MSNGICDYRFAEFRDSVELETLRYREEDSAKSGDSLSLFFETCGQATASLLQRATAKEIYGTRIALADTIRVRSCDSELAAVAGQC